MDTMQYALLAEVPGRWKADVLEELLRAEEIDVVLVDETVSAYPTSFAPVRIYVPKDSLKRAQQLLKAFDEADDTKEN